MVRMVNGGTEETEVTTEWSIDRCIGERMEFKSRRQTVR